MIPNSIVVTSELSFTPQSPELFRRETCNLLWLIIKEGHRFILKGLTEALRLHPEKAARLRKESSLGLRTNHPGVVGVYGFEQHPVAEPVILMKYADVSPWRFPQRR